MLTDICQDLKNWFVRDEQDKHFGKFTVGGSVAPLDCLQEGQYFRIVGSVFNDGVHKYDQDLDLVQETFDGAIWAMAVPKAVIDLDTEITSWQQKYGDDAAKPFVSESFGGYSYSKANPGSTAKGSDWRSTFAGRLNRWRKI